MLSNIIAVIIFPILAILTFCHRYEKGSSFSEFFGKRQTTVIKGIMIMVVYFHHYSHMVQNVDLIEYMYRTGQFCIATYFLISGYTTCLGYLKAECLDLKKIWINRAWRLYLPVMIFSVFMNNFLGGLLFFFVFTDVAFLIFKTNGKRLALITAGNILYVILLKVIGAEAYWYDDVLTYFVGAALAMYKNELIRFISGKKYWLICLLLVVICLPTKYLAFNWKYYDLSTIATSFTGAVLIVMILMRLNAKSAIFSFLGNYSWEIFMFHQMCIFAASRLFHHNVLIMVSSFGATIILSVILQKLCRLLRENLRKRCLVAGN